MTFCKYYDAGWCYAPTDVKTNALGSGVCNLPEYCPYLKSQNKMTDMFISKVLIEGDTATIMGVKYKRVEEPKPETLYDLIDKWLEGYDKIVDHNACNNETSIDYLVNDIEKWLPGELIYDGEKYHLGWNDAIRTTKDKLR